MANRLIHETSPYLLQHAHNPVDWYPWGEEALRHAREQNKPILLSIGYSSCHWCHVMERESFENPEIARLMNEHFINIKVDREERPDLDQIYMAAVQTLTGRGGWPLTVFLTPEGKPFYGGTYFPPEDRWGMRGLHGLLEDVAEAYRNRGNELDKVAERLQQQLEQALASQPSKEPLTEKILNNAFQTLKMSFDGQNGGLGAAPKFPQPLAFEFMLRYHHRKQAPEALEMVELTLAKMAWGGIRDHLGGGFHRYSTDAQWRVPHFEKMLYDNALLSRLYLHAYQATDKPLYRRIAEELLAYIKREMLSPEGGFYSTQDADSEGMEGKFYLWSQEEISRLLGKEDAALFNRYFGVTEEANFEGGNILYETMSLESLASEMGMRVEELEELIIRSKKRLLESRERRIKPERDEKILTCWNGLMMGAFAEAANILGIEDNARIAENNAAFLLYSLKGGQGLLRTYKDGKAKLLAYLEDYAAVIDGLLTLHEATFQPKWIEEARTLADIMVEEFWDKREKVFHDTGRRHDRLFLHPRDLSDNVLPSGSSNATQALLRLSIITGERNYAEVAEAGLQSVRKMMLDYPSSMANWLCALDFYLSTPREIAIIGPREDADTRALLSILYSMFLPNKVVVGLDTERPAKIERIPLLEGREMLDGHLTAYVCQKYTCLQPVTEPEELRKQLEAP